jgi:hypothetical protein
VERYTISGLHASPVTAIEWSMNGMKMFSGDKNGLVVLTEIDFYMVSIMNIMNGICAVQELGQFWQGQDIFLFSKLPRLALGPNQHPIQCI